MKLETIPISLVRGTEGNVDCLFEDKEKFKKILLGNTKCIKVAIAPIGDNELSLWKGEVIKILEGACNVDIAINPNSPNACVFGANDKVVEASYIVSYNMSNLNEINYDYFRELKKR